MIEKLLSAIAKELDKHQIPYMVIGGQAVLIYGFPRLTEDIDITLGVDVDKIGLIKDVCRRIGLRIPRQIDEDFINETSVLVAVDKRSRIRVDFIFSFTEYEKNALKRTKKIKMNNQSVRYASIEDVIIHKLFAGRPRDIEDVEIIMQKNKGKIDVVYLKRNLQQFASFENKKDIVKDYEDILERINR